MRKALLPALLLLAAFATPSLQARDLAALIADRVPLASNQTGITTSIRDALPVADHLAGIDQLTPLPLPEDFSFGPGYYRGTVRSYCLHAGTYGPTSGDGYLIAPLKGKHADIISGILERSAQHPEIAQSDVQRLIWAVEADSDWNSYDSKLKSRVAPLLTTRDTAVLGARPVRKEVGGKLRAGIRKLVPGAVQNVASEIDSWHGRLTRLDVPFEELERIGVLTGPAPWGKGSRKDVRPGNWAYVGDGFYLRTFSSSYRSTTLEIFRTGTAEVTRDALGRITRFDSDGYIIDTAYLPGDAPRTVDGRPVWRFSEVTFRHPDGRTRTIRDKGQVLASAAQPAGTGIAALASGLPMLMVVYGGAPKGDLGDMQHYEDGLKSATDPSDFQGRGEWLTEHFNRVRAAWQAAIDALAGDSGDAPPGPEKRSFNPGRHVAAPANTSRQRLGMSPVLQSY